MCLKSGDVIAVDQPSPAEPTTSQGTVRHELSDPWLADSETSRRILDCDLHTHHLYQKVALAK